MLSIVEPKPITVRRPAGISGVEPSSCDLPSSKGRPITIPFSYPYPITVRRLLGPLPPRPRLWEAVWPPQSNVVFVGVDRGHRPSLGGVSGD